MKKVLFFALAAFCVSAAQAVTMTWSGAGTHTLSNAISFTDGVAYTLTLAFEKTGDQYLNQIIGAYYDANGTSSNPRFFQMNGAGNTNITTDIVASGAWYTGFGVNSSNWRNFSNIPTGNISSMIFVITGTGTSDGKLGDISVGIQYNGGTLQNVTTNANWNGVGTIESVTVLPHEAFSTAQLSTTLTVTETVPEPTALALLALGVAGLALKRKTA